MPRLRFYVKIFEGLMNPLRNKNMIPQALQPNERGDVCNLEVINGRKREDCMVCSDRASKKRKRTAYECIKCKKGCCPTCFAEHFKG